MSKTNTGYAPKPVTKPKENKLQQQVEELCGASIRAMSGERRFAFRGRRPEVNGQPSGIRAPHLQAKLYLDDFDGFRGAADGIAQRLKFSDIGLHRSLLPESEVGQLIFELLEQLRVETLIEDKYPGARKNLDYRYKQWCAQFCNSKMTENHIGLLVYTITQVAWSRLSGQPVNESTEGLIEPNRMMLAPHIGSALVGMKRSLHNQAQFAQHALDIARTLESLVEKLDSSEDKAQQFSKAKEAVDSFGLTLYPETSLNGELASSANSTGQQQYRELLTQLQDYPIYSTENDRIISAEKLVASFLRKKLRAQLDKKIKGQGVNIPRLARELAKILSSPELDGWSFGEEDGYLDARRLTRLVTSPNYRQLFRKEHHQLKSQCQVSFLVDNSGSMKEYIEQIAVLIEIMACALERAGARTEILGFTTRSWQGGKLFKRWSGSGKQANPGRLAELEHIIYKDAGTSIKQALNSISALLKPDIFKEGIDGEALLWAAQRLIDSPQERKILIVLSDGCPMETATSQSNGEGFLDNHLQQVAAMLEARGDIELYALGFGLDLSPYYKNNLALDLPTTLENHVFKDILRMLARRK